MELGGRFFRLGVPLALSLTGYLHLRSQSQLITPSPSPSPSCLSASKPSAASPTGGLKDELRILTIKEDLAKIINGMGTTTTTTTSTNNSRYDDDLLFPVSKHQLLLEEKGDPTTTPKLEIQEFEVRNLVEESLLERQRERALETQMLEYHESKAKELETQLKANTTEAHLLSLKMEALQAENLRLCTLVSDYSKVITKLKSATARARARARARKKLLQQKRDDTEVENKLKRLEELEEMATDLMKVNSRLAQESSELKLELNSVEEEAKCLREENGKLLLDLEHLNSDRPEEQVEELVYLRWVNACLRFELRNNQPPARDLSRILSPESEQQANCGFGERNIISLTDLESDSSTASNKEPPSMTKRNRSAKPKFISKLKRLVLGKDRHSKSGNPMRRGSVSPCPLEDEVGSGVSPHNSSSCTSVELVPDNQQTVVGGVGDEHWQNRGVEPQSSSRSFNSLGPKRLIYRSYRYRSMAMGDNNKIHLSLNSRPERIDFKDPLLS